MCNLTQRRRTFYALWPVTILQRTQSHFTLTHVRKLSFIKKTETLNLARFQVILKSPKLFGKIPEMLQHRTAHGRVAATRRGHRLAPSRYPGDSGRLVGHGGPRFRTRRQGEKLASAPSGHRCSRGAAGALADATSLPHGRRRHPPIAPTLGPTAANPPVLRGRNAGIRMVTNGREF